MRGRLHIALVMFAAIAFTPHHAAAQTDDNFYRGKNLNLYVGSQAGEGWDVYGRLFGKYFVKHLPGNPTLVPQNLPGAGGLIMVNYLYTRAPQDGTSIGIGPQAAYFEPLFGNQQAKFDPLKFLYLGSINQDVYVCVAWHTAKTKSLEDAMKQETLLANTAPDSNGYIYMQLMNAIIGTKFKTVSGYPGSNQIYLAMQQGEVDTYCGNTFSSVRSVHQDWMDKKLISFMVQIGMEKSKYLPDVPLVMDYVKDEASRETFAAVLGNLKMARTIVASPNIPPERAAMLRRAFDETIKDPDFLAEAAQAQLPVDVVNGADVEKIVKSIYQTPKEAIDRVVAIRSSKN